MAQPSGFIKVHCPVDHELGCPSGDDTMPGSHWVCTDHITWNGELLHVAGSTHDVAGAWLDDDRRIDFGLGDSRPHTWEDFEARLMEDDNFSPAPSEEDLRAAQEHLSKMLQELGSDA